MVHVEVLKNRSNFKVKVRRSKLWYLQKGLVMKNSYMKYEIPITYHSKDMANVKAFKK
jgi:uncharacterized protein YcfL